MAKLIIEMPTLKQAKEYANWFEGQGEQYACEWIEEHNLEPVFADVQTKGWLKVDKKEETVTMKTK